MIIRLIVVIGVFVCCCCHGTNSYNNNKAEFDGKKSTWSWFHAERKIDRAMQIDTGRLCRMRSCFLFIPTGVESVLPHWQISCSESQERDTAARNSISFICCSHSRWIWTKLLFSHITMQSKRNERQSNKKYEVRDYLACVIINGFVRVHVENVTKKNKYNEKWKCCTRV